MSQIRTAVRTAAHAVLLMTIFAAASPAQDAAKPTPDLTAGKGFRIYESGKGTLNFSAFTYVRYLNQRGLDPTYTNSFGKTVSLDRRDDLQIQKVVLYFKGWLVRPRNSVT